MAINYNASGDRAEEVRKQVEGEGRKAVVVQGVSSLRGEESLLRSQPAERAGGRKGGLREESELANDGVVGCGCPGGL